MLKKLSRHTFRFSSLSLIALLASCQTIENPTVTDPEPLTKGHRLWKMPNVIITPHVAGRSAVTTQRRAALLRENLRRFAAGKPLMNVVDKKLGY